MMVDSEMLRKISFFEGLIHEHLKLVVGITREVTHPPGTKIFAHRDPPDALYFIIKGKVRISREIPGMGEEALAVLEPGACFGEMALIDDSARSADAICNTTVTCGVIDKDAFENLLFLNKDLAYELLWTMVRTVSARLRESNEKMSAFLTMAGAF